MGFMFNVEIYLYDFNLLIISVVDNTYLRTRNVKNMLSYEFSERFHVFGHFFAFAYSFVAYEKTLAVCCNFNV